MIDSLLGLGLFNTYIGLVNINKNAAQHDALQQILTILKGEKPMHKELIRLIDKEVEELVIRECNGLTTVGQNQLHLLLENRKDLMKMGEWHDAGEQTEYSRGGGRSGI